MKGKIFCGYCGHALTYYSRKSPYYYCRHSDADENKPCYKMRFDAKVLEDAVFTTLKAQMDVLGSDGIKRASLGNAVVFQHLEYERQINALEESKLRLYEQYQLREIDLDTFKAKKEALNAQLLKIKNAYAALTAQAKREQEAKDKEVQRRSITKELTEATGLTSALADLLIDKIQMYPEGRIGIEYKIQDLLY